MAAEGINLAVLAQLMGHSDIKTTTRYIAVNSEAHQKAVAIMDKFITPALQNASANKADIKAVPVMDYVI